MWPPGWCKIQIVARLQKRLSNGYPCVYLYEDMEIQNIGNQNHHYRANPLFFPSCFDHFRPHDVFIAWAGYKWENVPRLFLFPMPKRRFPSSLDQRVNAPPSSAKVSLSIHEIQRTHPKWPHLVPSGYLSAGIEKYYSSIHVLYF